MSAEDEMNRLDQLNRQGWGKLSLRARVFTVAIFVFGGAALLFAGFFFNMLRNSCSEERIAEVLSPTGEYAATVFRRNCGATEPFVTHVNLRIAAQKHDANWLGVIVNGQVFEIRGDTSLEVEWADRRDLLIVCRACKEMVNHVETKWRTVNILARVE